jgi:hypothetical protein
MKGKLNENGLLLVERKGEYVTQLCPYTSFRHDGGSSAMGCGHWCPLFGESISETSVSLGTTGRTLLRVCHKTLVFDELTDERLTCN